MRSLNHKIRNENISFLNNNKILLNISQSPSSYIISPSAIVWQYIRDFINTYSRHTSSSLIIKNVWYSIKFIEQFLSRSTSFLLSSSMFFILGFSFKDWACLTVNNDMLNLLALSATQIVSEIERKDSGGRSVMKSDFGWEVLREIIYSLNLCLATISYNIEFNCIKLTVN